MTNRSSTPARVVKDNRPAAPPPSRAQAEGAAAPSGAIPPELVPGSAEVEEAAIGGILQNPEAFYEVSLYLKPKHFRALSLNYIYEAIVRLHEKRIAIDYLTLVSELKAAGTLQMVGGPAYITSLINAAPNSQHTTVYAGMVHRAAMRREILTIADEARIRALDEMADLDDTRDYIARAVLTLEDSASVVRGGSMNDLMAAHAAWIAERMSREGEIPGIPSSLDALNEAIGAYEDGALYLIGGRPGMGKSSMMTTEAVQAARHLKSSDEDGVIVYVTLEMPANQVVNNVVSAETGIPARILKAGRMTPEQLELYTRAGETLGQLPLYVDDTPAMNPVALRAILNRNRLRYGSIRAVYVDYIQLMSGSDSRYGNRDQELGEVSRALKQIAKDFECPVIAGAQLNRGVEDRQDKRPRLSDLRESGNLEADADVVMLLYNDLYYNPPDEEWPEIGMVEIGIAKHRDGQTGMIRAGFWGEFKAFIDWNPAIGEVDF